MFNSEQKNISPRPRRRRSSSLDSRNIIKYREENFLKFRNPEKPMKKYASISNLFNPDNSSNEKTINSPKQKLKMNMDYNYFLLVNWYKDFKSIKNVLITANDQNIFKNGFIRKNDAEEFSKLIYIVGSNFKSDNEYEIYLINDYDERLREFLNWSKSTNDEQLMNEYTYGKEFIDKQVSDENTRYSEIMALFIQCKNQPMQSFLPRFFQDQPCKAENICEFEIFYSNQDKKTEKNTKSLPRYGILSNHDVHIFSSNNRKLKDTYILRHLYVGQCQDAQIANIDSCLRIGGPLGNDMIIRFPSPQIRNEWNTIINREIATYQEIIKNIPVNIAIFNEVNQAPSAPLVSKSFSINGATTGLSLKKMAMETFEIKDIDMKDLSIVFSIKNKENMLHDEVTVLILQEHVNSAQENNCSKSCISTDKATNAVKINYYLRSNKSPNDNLFKDGFKGKKNAFSKSKPNKYDINARWSNNEIPNWLMNLLADLYNEGVKSEGIFRVSGSVVQSDDFINQISETDDLKIDTSIHNKANILKKFISIIDGSLLKSVTKEQFINLTNDINSIEEYKKQEEQLIEIMQKIPDNHRNLFQHILVVLDHILKNSQINQMNSSNLATCFSQNLFKHLSDDPCKINKLFELILKLIPHLVNGSTYDNIVASYNKRKPSVGSGESYPKSDGMSTLEFEFSSVTSRTGSSDMIDDFKTNSQPVVPPRRKKGTKPTPLNFETLNTEKPSHQIPVLPRKNKGHYDHSKRTSVPLETLQNDLNLEMDEPDLPRSLNMTDDTNSNPKRISRSRKTFNTVSSIETQQKNNFYRQNQVNRKYQMQKNIFPPDNTKQAKSNAKLTRGRIVNPRSRSTTRIGEEESEAAKKTIHNPLKSTFHYNADSSNDLRSLPSYPLRDRRSSSDNQVKRLAEQFENQISTPKPQVIPRKKEPLILENDKRVSKVIKDFEEHKVNKIPSNRKLGGPIRPSHSVQSVSAQRDLSKEKHSASHPLHSPKFNSSHSSVQERLNDGNDDDVTYI